ncbi:UNVERIFIED_CONTAM: Cellulose synthase-like protein G3 [Sesamum calycinum]|uniref:Cellulose synthase-like protein G3 n=1 Tax=Sesamum calycinum TaxID=2727403 RepID=A0AAW2K6E1_9LAMI
MYENMKTRVENVVKTGYITEEYRSSKHEAAFGKYKAEDFTIHHHPPIIQVVSESREEKDVGGCCMPNLIYVSRQKIPTSPHHFKAGALNVLLRVSAVTTNAPTILTLDCDMVSNDPSTPFKMLCYFMDNSIGPNLAMFSSQFVSMGSKADIYSSEFKRVYHINPIGLNGLSALTTLGLVHSSADGPSMASPIITIMPEIPELTLDYVVEKPVHDRAILELAHYVASSEYENQTKWGSEVGFRYGSLVEDYTPVIDYIVRDGSPCIAAQKGPHFCPRCQSPSMTW